MVMESAPSQGRSSWPLLDSRIQTCEKAERPLTTASAFAGYLRASSERPARGPAPKSEMAGNPNELPATGHRVHCAAGWQPAPRLLAAHRFGTEGGYRAGGDRVPYSAPAANRIGARLRRLAAEYAPSGGPDEDGRPGPEGFPGLGQGAELLLGSWSAKVIELLHQGQQLRLASRQHIGEPGAPDYDQGAVERTDAGNLLQPRHGLLGAEREQVARVEPALLRRPGNAVQPLHPVRRDAGERLHRQNLLRRGQRRELLAGQVEDRPVGAAEPFPHGHHLLRRPPDA